MSPEMVIGFARQSIELTLMLCLPMMGVGMVVGILLSILQTATQIQEATLTQIPKMVAMFIALILAFPWLMERMLTFTKDIFINLPMYIK